MLFFALNFALQIFSENANIYAYQDKATTGMGGFCFNLLHIAFFFANGVEGNKFLTIQLKHKIALGRSQTLKRDHRNNREEMSSLMSFPVQNWGAA